MAKTKQIGVRFDEELWEKFDKMGYTTAQKKLNFLESWYLDNLEKVISFNNQATKKAEIEEKRNYSNPLSEQDKWGEPLTQNQITEIAENSLKFTRTSKPERIKGEDSVDYAGRVNEWKKTLNK